ncbi:hypothetical protein CR492_14585 [Methylocella silvestris]|uniref:Uncharacterized protein n=1 Tax=Methylocella silvestris TaxID=199596 RepID=A0A2J7TEL3_METSI|nr:hypothetical protein CR492_14585 [Methylocella silvestris]
MTNDKLRRAPRGFQSQEGERRKDGAAPEAGRQTFQVGCPTPPDLLLEFAEARHAARACRRVGR